MKNLILLLSALLTIQCSKKLNSESKQTDIKYLEANPPILQPGDFVMDSKPVLIQGAKIMTATGETLEKGSVLMEKGKIVKVSASEIDAPEGTDVIHAEGLVVTPGIIDVHSHMGVYPSPMVDAHGDGNEASRPVTSDVWAEHGFWPQDPDLWRAQAGGITTIQVLPGSANLIGGRSFVAKLIPALNPRDMRFPGAPQGLKMACGENPKRVYHDKGLQTRMGNVAGYRKAFQEALEYARQWEEYEKNNKDSKKKDLSKIPKRNFVSETLMKILKGEILLHFHCYRADDINNILDVAKEFGFKIRTIHHGLEAYKLAPRLAKEEVATATWADWWGFKAEAYDGIPYNAALLQQAGARPIIHSDSAVDIRFLNLEAGKALASAKKLGLNFTEEQALGWITKNAAWALGLENKIGTIEEGKHADLVLWDGHPFSIYSKTKMVFINGEKVFDRDNKLRIKSDFEMGYNEDELYDGREFSPAPVTSQIQWDDTATASEEFTNRQVAGKDSSSFYLTNVKAFVDGKWLDLANVVVRDGVIAEINPAQTPQGLAEIKGHGRSLTPGLIESQSMLGLFEIALDTRAQDLRNGSATPTPDFQVIDSLNLDTVRLPIARHEGITTAVAKMGGSFAGSMGAAFDTDGSTVIAPHAALFGTVVKYGKYSRAELWNELRQFVEDAQLFLSNPSGFNQGLARPVMTPTRQLRAMGPVLEGKIPWVIEAHRAGDIKNLIQLKKDYPKIRLILSGSGEAWKVADELKEAGIPVMLAPSEQTPRSFDQVFARFDQAAYLNSKGVEIIFTDGNDNGAGRTRQEAGFAAKYGLPKDAALKAITETPGKIFGLNRGKIAVGQVANLVLWNGDPLEPTSWTEKVWLSGKEQSLKTRHISLAQSYLKKQEETKKAK